MRAPFILAAAAAATLFAAACGGASSAEALGEDAFDALKAGDFQSWFDDSVVTPSLLLETCPNVRQFTVDPKKHEDAFAECRRKVDFTNAKLESVTTMGNAGTFGTCGGGSDVELVTQVAVKVSTADRIYTFFVEDAVKTKDGWKTAAKLHCP